MGEIRARRYTKLLRLEDKVKILNMEEDVLNENVVLNYEETVKQYSINMACLQQELTRLTRT